jgi:hypothetical protein
MFEKNCPCCSKPVSIFSKGAMKGNLTCPHCAGNIKSKPSSIGMVIAAAIGGGIGAVLHISLAYTVPVAIILSIPFVIKLVKSE